MKRFLFVTALTVLACTAIGAEPTPARRSALLPPVPAPAELSDTTPMKAEAAQAPSCTTQAPSCVAQAPPAQAPTCGVEAHVCDRCELEVCVCRRSYAPGRFLVNEFVRRPVYGVQKAMTDAEARRFAVSSAAWKLRLRNSLLMEREFMAELLVIAERRRRLFAPK